MRTTTVGHRVQLITRREEFPACVRGFKELKGIAIGCLNDGFIDGEWAAHAHCCRGDKYRGWICLTYKLQLGDRYTLLHELAHILAATPNHGKDWAQGGKGDRRNLQDVRVLAQWHRLWV